MSKHIKIQENVYNTFLALKTRKRQQEFLEKWFIYAWEGKEIETKDSVVSIAFLGVKPSLKISETSNNWGGLRENSGRKSNQVDNQDDNQDENQLGIKSKSSPFISNKDISKKENKSNINKIDSDTVQKFVDRWNRGIGSRYAPKIVEMNPSRISKLNARLQQAVKFYPEMDGIDAFFEILNNAWEHSSFLRGERTDFKISIDFLLQESSFIKLAEGAYNDKQ